MELSDVTSWRGLFTPDGCYLNTASMGLPPRPAAAAVGEQVDRWATGRIDTVDYWALMDLARRRYAALMRVSAAETFVGSQTSVITGLIAAAVPDGAVVVVPEGDYPSVSYPLWAHRDRLQVRTVAWSRLLEAIDPDVTLVALSAVQFTDGRITELGPLVDACEAVGAEVFCDLTQAAGWLPLDLTRVGYTACSAYKWLMSPRGTAYGTVRADLIERIRPLNANPDAAGGEMYVHPPTWAPDASRFDVTPAWPAWAGATAALDVVAAAGVARIHDHNTGLASACSEALGLPDNGSAIIAVDVDDDTVAAVADAGITAVVRAGKLRLAFAMHNTDDDVDRVVDVLRGRVRH